MLNIFWLVPRNAENEVCGATDFLPVYTSLFFIVSRKLVWFDRINKPTELLLG